MIWIKASEKLPQSTNGKKSVAGRRNSEYGYDHFQIVPDDNNIYVAYKWYSRQSCPEDFEWLDEPHDVSNIEDEQWKIDFYEFDTNLPFKPMASNTNERIAWLEENYKLIPLK